MTKYNHRLSYRKRRAKAIERSKPPVKRRCDARLEERRRSRKGWFAILVLLPVAAVSVITAVEMLFQARTASIWRTEEFLLFALGCLAWAGAFWAGWRPMRSYVFAHEMTHLLAARLFGGKIFDWKVSAEGGYVETNKTNTWITLGPYLVPFYSVLVMLAFGAAAFFLDMAQWHPVRLGGFAGGYRWVWLLYWLIGFTWCFHLTFTVRTIHTEQGDLTRNGEFFSLLVIFLVNLALIFAMFVAASPSVSFADAGAQWLTVARGSWEFLKNVFG